MTERENLLRTVRFERPDYIPMVYHINSSCWDYYPHDALQELKASHPFLFPGVDESSPPVVPDYPPFARAGEPYIDPWGCVWETSQDGIAGVVTKHPLESWDDFANYVPPDPNKVTHWGPIDWEETKRGVNPIGFITCMPAADIGHGHTFLKLTDIRGYESVILDMADDEPRLRRLLDMITDFNMGLVRNFIDRVGTEWLGYADDLGMQFGPMISPSEFRKFIKPVYRRLMEPAREAGCVVHMHSDGDIRELVDDLIEVGVEVINLQDLVNGIDWIREHLAGRVCIDLDIDRQRITAAGTPDQIDALIREEIEKLGSREGGLMLTYGLYPGTPLENAWAVADAMEKYATYHRG